MTPATSLPPISEPVTPPPGLFTRLRHTSVKQIVTSKKFLIGLFILLLLSTATIAFLPRYQFQPRPTPQPLATPQPTPEPSTLPASPFATDSAVLKIETDLTSLQNQLNQADMGETDLLPPPLDLNVSFE